MVYVSGPRHGGPSVVTGAYLEGTCCEICPNISQGRYAGGSKLEMGYSLTNCMTSHMPHETEL